ncbi:MAG: hypothetical protein V3T77_03940, partial [Planctomycetota bacterium]
TGEGSGEAGVQLVEFEQNPDYPNGLGALSVALTHDPELLEATEVRMGDGLLAIDDGAGPAFFEVAIYTQGYTVGVVVDFSTTEVLLVADSKEIVIGCYATQGEVLAGNEIGTVTSLDFVNGLLGPIPVDNLVVVGVDPYGPFLESGEVTLIGSDLPLFRRGDDNGDGTINVADPVYSIGFLFKQGPSTCLDAMDTNNDGQVDSGDSIYNLTYLFAEGPPPPPPFASCGVDGDLGCETQSESCL